MAGRDIAFLERVLPSDYVMTGTSGRKANRGQVLKFFTQERDKPSYRMLSVKHEQVMVRAVSNMAVVTNAYTTQTTPIETPHAEPDTYTGRHTGVFEKRNGRWMVIAEQDSEQPHDDKLMERQVTKASREYHTVILRLLHGRGEAELATGSDLAALTRTLATEYIGTSEDGAVTNKAQTIERFKASQRRLSAAERSEHRVLAIDNNAAVETGTVRYVGSEAGMPFRRTERYTTTWVSWAHGWQIVAHHASVVKE